MGSQVNVIPYSVLANPTSAPVAGVNASRKFLQIQNKALDGATVTFKFDSDFTPARSGVQTIAFNGTPNAGALTLHFNGYTTSSLNYNAAASDVQSALQALT